MGLSKWVHQLVRHHDTFTGARQSLESFSQCQLVAVETFEETQSQAAPQYPSPSTATSPSPEIITPHKPSDSPPAQPKLHTEVQAANSESRSSVSGDQKNIQHPSEPSRECIVQRTPWSTSHLFTSTPVSSQFKIPVFQSEPDEKSVNNKQVQKEVIPVLPVAPKHQINGAHDLNDISVEPQHEQIMVIPTSTLRQNTSGMDCEDTEEDEQSIFYSPELFEGGKEEKDETMEVKKSPPEVNHPLAKSRARGHCLKTM